MVLLNKIGVYVTIVIRECKLSIEYLFKCKPSSSIWPLQGSYYFINKLEMEDLPAPLSPTKANIFPGVKSNDISFNTLF